MHSAMLPEEMPKDFCRGSLRDERPTLRSKATTLMVINREFLVGELRPEAI
jgi:hypothetical protein